MCAVSLAVENAAYAFRSRRNDSGVVDSERCKKEIVKLFVAINNGVYRRGKRCFK